MHLLFCGYGFVMCIKFGGAHESNLVILTEIFVRDLLKVPETYLRFQA